MVVSDAKPKSWLRQAASWIPVLGFGLESYDAFKGGHWIQGSLLLLAAVGDAATLGEEGLIVHAGEEVVEHEIENTAVKAEEEIAERAEQVAAQAKKEVKELPTIDATGKVHGELPKVKDLNKYSKEQLETLQKELKESVQKRIEVTSKLGRDKAHGQRQGAEQDLIKAIEKHLQNRIK